MASIEFRQVGSRTEFRVAGEATPDGVECWRDFNALLTKDAELSALRARCALLDDRVRIAVEGFVRARSRALAAESRVAVLEAREVAILKRLDEAHRVIVNSYGAIPKEKADYLRDLMDWVDKALEARAALAQVKGDTK